MLCHKEKSTQHRNAKDKENPEKNEQMIQHHTEQLLGTKETPYRKESHQKGRSCVQTASDKGLM